MMNFYDNLLRRYKLKIKYEKDIIKIFFNKKLILIINIDKGVSNLDTIILTLLKIKPMFYGMMEYEIIYINPELYKLLRLKFLKIKKSDDFTSIIIYDPKKCIFNSKELKNMFSNVKENHYNIGLALGFPKKAILDFCERKENRIGLRYYGFTLSVSKENYQECLKELKERYNIPIILRI